MIKAVLKHWNGTYLRTGDKPGEWENVGDDINRATVFHVGMWFHPAGGTLEVSCSPSLPFDVGNDPDELKRAKDYQFAPVADDQIRELV